MPKLTKRIIDAVEPQATEFFLWDEGIPGFGLRVIPSGRKSFAVQFRAGRRARRMNLGPSTVLTCDQARTRAITCVGRMNGSSRPTADTRPTESAAVQLSPKRPFRQNAAFEGMERWQCGTERAFVAFADCRLNGPTWD